MVSVTLKITSRTSIFHQDNMSVCFIHPYIPLLYSKTGIYREIHYVLIFALKYILWVLGSNVYPQYMF